MSKIEEKERKNEQKSLQGIKKPPQKFYSSNERRPVPPVIDAELKKKIEKADIVSKDKKDGVKKQSKVNNFTYFATILSLVSVKYLFFNSHKINVNFLL